LKDKHTSKKMESGTEIRSPSGGKPRMSARTGDCPDVGGIAPTEVQGTLEKKSVRQVGEDRGLTSLGRDRHPQAKHAKAFLFLPQPDGVS
jgi:hypothetical protein